MRAEARRIIIFGTPENLRMLTQLLAWLIDGTFKPSPQLFYQLLTIHAESPPGPSAGEDYVDYIYSATHAAKALSEASLHYA